MVSLKLKKDMLNLLPVYALDISKTKGEKETFYENLHIHVETTTNNSKTIIIGDFNV